MRGVLAGLMVLCLAGCAWLQLPAPEVTPAPPPPAAAPPPDYAEEKEEVVALLTYYSRVAGLSAEELRREHQAAVAAYGKDRTEFGRLRLVLLYSLPTPVTRDDAKLAGALLEASPARNGPPESPRRQFVTLLQKLTAERQREQRRADELQQRAEELQRKLDAMVEIERSLRGRKKRP